MTRTVTATEAAHVPTTFPGIDFGTVAVEHEGFTVYTVVSRATGGHYFITSNVVREGAVSFSGTAPVTIDFATELLIDGGVWSPAVRNYGREEE